MLDRPITEQLLANEIRLTSEKLWIGINAKADSEFPIVLSAESAAPIRDNLPGRVSLFPVQVGWKLSVLDNKDR